jgi:hypothetical protein
MLEFFMDGGWPMFPIVALGLALLYAATRYALDRETFRLRLVGVLSLAVLGMSVLGFLFDAAKVLTFWAGWMDPERPGGNPLPEAQRVTVALLGAQESTCTLIFGLGFLGLGFVLVAIGAYQAGRRELAAQS